MVAHQGPKSTAKSALIFDLRDEIGKFFLAQSPCCTAWGADGLVLTGFDTSVFAGRLTGIACAFADIG